MNKNADRGCSVRLAQIRGTGSVVNLKGWEKKKSVRLRRRLS